VCCWVRLRPAVRFCTAGGVSLACVLRLLQGGAAVSKASVLLLQCHANAVYNRLGSLAMGDLAQFGIATELRKVGVLCYCLLLVTEDA
jgi:hypothetical protein